MDLPLPEDFSPEHLDEIQIRDKEGLVVGLIGFSITLYIQSPNLSHLRQSAAEVLDNHLRAIGGELRWMMVPNRPGYRRASSVRSFRFVEAILAMSEDEDFEFEAHSGPTRKEAGHYSISVYLPSDPNCLGFITLTLPFSWGAVGSGGRFQRLLLTFCQATKPWHGYGGLALVHNPNYGHALSAEPFLYPYAIRFPGLELDRPVTHSRLCRDGIKGVNWLTVLSMPLLDRVGGVAAMRAALDPQDFNIQDYPGGVILQAGPTPQLGDSDKGLSVPAYQMAGRFLRPLRAPHNDIVAKTPKGVNALAFARTWLSRFD